MESQQSHTDTEELESLFVTFARSVLAQMVSWVEQGERFEYLSPKVYFTEDGPQMTTRSVYEPKKDYWMLLQRHTEAILMTGEAQHCAREHWKAGLLGLPQNLEMSDSAGNPIVNPPFEQVREALIQDLFLPIRDICTRYHTFDPTDEQLVEQYHRYKDLWTAPTIRVDVTFPLVNFTSNLAQENKIGTHLRLALFPLEERMDIWNEGMYYFSTVPKPMEQQAFASTHFKLSGVRYQEKDTAWGTYTNQEIVSELGTALNALRLLKPGHVGAPAIFEKGYTSSLWQTAAVSRPLHAYRTRELPFADMYMFNETDLPDFRMLYNALLRLNPEAPSSRSKKKATQQSQREIRQLYGDLTFALRRFNLAYSREIPEDQIVDLTIALESCLVPGQVAEITYKFALRGTALLAMARAENWKPHRSKLLLEAIYKVRSLIVHSGMKLADLDTKIKDLQEVGILPHQFLRHCEDITREILKAVVLRRASGQSKDAIIADVESWIVKSITAHSAEATEPLL